MGYEDKVLIPKIHHHPMTPTKDHRGKCDCCGRKETIVAGYYCKICNFFVHKNCVDEASRYIRHPSHPEHALLFRTGSYHHCNFCERSVGTKPCYRCEVCNFTLDLCCAKYPPPKVIDNSEMHHHKLTFRNFTNGFDCAKCEEKDIYYEFSYKCQECDLSFHQDCVWDLSEVKHLSEVNHSFHSLHPLKLMMGKPPEYSDGKCRLCTRKIDDRFFYHCSSCNFTLDMHCVLHPPLQSLQHLKAHAHQLTLLPRLDAFTCNACGLKGDRSPYVCFQCGFMTHQDCLGLPRVININRHDHRVSRTSVLGVVNSECGVCRKKVDWTCGGYSCQKCPDYVIHSKCATRDDVWNGEELEGVPEEIEDIEPYEVIDDNTIRHFSHKEHYLRLNGNGLLWEGNKRCNACNHTIGLQSFYGCVDCDFILHRKCAEFPRKKRHFVHNERLTLVTNGDFFWCAACCRVSNGFKYKDGRKAFDVLCISISEPFVLPSHPLHPLYYVPPNEHGICKNCRNDRYITFLRCIEDDCDFCLCFECATLPQVVKHKVDEHPLSLCYGENQKDASGKYWCDICEKQTNPKRWFYTCKDQRLSLHTKCVLGDFSRLMPRSTIEYEGKPYEVVLNNSVSRPFCRRCESRCMHPIFLKKLGTSDTYLCSLSCIFNFSISEKDEYLDWSYY